MIFNNQKTLLTEILELSTIELHDDDENIKSERPPLISPIDLD
jgi:hypothetical protein